MSIYNGSGSNNDLPLRMAMDNAGNIYVVGDTTDLGSSTDMFVLKYNASGILQWKQRYNGTKNGTDEGLAIAVDSSGNVYITGYSNNTGTNADITTIKYDTNGVQKWVQFYNGTSNSSDQGNAIAVDINSNVYVTGYSQNTTTGVDITTLKYDTNGVQQWVQTKNGTSNGSDTGYAIALDSRGNVYVTGDTVGQVSSTDVITFQYYNPPPVAVNDVYSTGQGTPLNVAAPGVLFNDSDPGNQSLSVSLATGPSHGSVTLNSDGSFLYTPNANFTGQDTFTYTLLNSGGATATATVTITVIGKPVANSQSVSTGQATAIGLTLTGSDPNTPPQSLTYIVTVNPTHGTLTGTAPNLTYTPNANYFGPDSFQFKVNNGFLDSDPATVTLTVNGKPTANSQSVTITQDTPKAITLTGSDPNMPPLSLTYIVTSGTAHGTLSGTAPNITYTPNDGYYGSDSFQFKVNNGFVDSSPATVSITVIGKPTANGQSVNVSQDTPKSITLTGADPNTPPLSLSYTVTTNPMHGTLTGTAPNLTYTPNAGYYGSDSFSFKVNNGSIDSDPATVSITLIGKPIANPQSVTTDQDTAVGITLTDSDPNTPPLGLTYTVTTNPMHGTLTGTAPNLTYTLETGYYGNDSFQFTVNNGHFESLPATVSLLVRGPANPVPTLNSINPTSVTAGAGAVTLTLTGTNFVANSQVRANTNVNLATTYVSSTTLKAVAPASLTATAGTVLISVVNPSPGGGTSNSLPLSVVGAPRLSLTSVTASRNGQGQVVLIYALTNVGTDTALNVNTTSGRILGTGGATVPAVSGPYSLAPNASIMGTIVFPATVPAGSPVFQLFGAMNGSSYSLSRTVTIP